MTTAVSINGDRLGGGGSRAVRAGIATRRRVAVRPGRQRRGSSGRPGARHQGAGGSAMRKLPDSGAAEHSYGLYTRQDARRLRCTLIAALEEMSVDPGRSLSVVIVGGGPTGLEMAGTLADLRNIALKAAYPEVAPERVRVTLVEQG